MGIAKRDENVTWVSSLRKTDFVCTASPHMGIFAGSTWCYTGVSCLKTTRVFECCTEDGTNAWEAILVRV